MKMKKIIILSSLFIATSLQTFAQNSVENKLVNKKGIAIHPEVGDWSIGVDATPFLNYVGNLVKIAQASNAAPSFGFTAQNPGTIVGKYVASENKVYRVALTIGISVESQDIVNPLNQSKPNTYKTSALALGLTAGIENRKPYKNRLIGFYGYEAGLLLKPYEGFSRATGNSIVGRISFESETNSSSNYIEKGGNRFSLIAAGFAGVEYFFAPKISLSGEFSLLFEAYMKTDRKYEPETGSKEIIDAQRSGVTISPVPSGALTLNLYF